MTTSENSQEQVLLDALESASSSKPKKHKVHRNRVKMMADVLEAARSGALKTHIMYSSNLSYTNLTELLNFLIENGLLKEERDVHGKGASLTRYYITTDKGYVFLEQFKQLHSLLSDSENLLSEAFQY